MLVVVPDAGPNNVSLDDATRFIVRVGTEARGMARRLPGSATISLASQGSSDCMPER